jgi:hypothetical protein
LDEQSGSLSIYRDPSPRGYQQVLTAGRNDTVSPAMLPGVKLDLANLWG